ncbi:MAG: S8 family serine peptidase [Acidobacteria bacterium]|nr:S8 family serine peptidase [Acidobacteriota bacterium]MBV9476835.1 S8 family serine peptidase [Acidobacteriota bacterium]
MRRLPIVFVLLLATSTLFAAERFDRDSGLARDNIRARHVILQPEQPLTDADRAELRAKGIDVQHPLTGGRWVARVTASAEASGDARIASLEPLGADRKILHSALKDLGRGRAWANLAVLFHDDVAFDEARNAILAAGGQLDPLTVKYLPSQRIEARIAPSAVATLAADDRVLAISGRPRHGLTELNTEAGSLAKVDVVQAAPYNLSGAGINVGVSEISVAQADHPEFQGRLQAFAQPGGSEVGEHSTHVSGTIGAAGIRPDAKGMAPASHIYQYDVGTGVGSMLDVFDNAFPSLGLVSNNISLGFPLGWCTSCDGAGFPVWLDTEEYYGAYEAGYGVPAIDDSVLRDGILHVFAAGNDGALPGFEQDGQHRHVNPDTGDTDKTKIYCVSRSGSGNDCPLPTCNGGCERAQHHRDLSPFDTMSVTGSAKNVITVGAVQPIAGTVVPVSFSSRGPAKDGRVKPEVVARGWNTLSTVPVNSYATSSGTSMAAPVVTGIAALLAEQWEKLHQNAKPGPVVLKALLIAGADDLGNPGPDYSFGFGSVDAKNSVDLIIGDNGQGTQIRSTSIAQGQSYEMPLNVTAQQNLRVVLQWGDPSVILLGDDSFEAKALVNDLDVKIVDPNGATHLPYVLDKVNYQANATTGVNTVDNTEMVEIANATPGVYRVVVTGSHVTSGPQAAVIVANAKAAPAAPPCSDPTEMGGNDTPATAYGDVPTEQTVSGAICTQNDVDYFRFTATKNGPMTVTITAADTPLRVTETASNGLTSSVDVPAHATRTVTLQYGSGNGVATALPVTVRVEANGTLGANSSYTVKFSYGTFVPPRRRSVR